MSTQPTKPNEATTGEGDSTRVSRSTVHWLPEVVLCAAVPWLQNAAT
jgi:hypothetical protein